MYSSKKQEFFNNSSTQIQAYSKYLVSIHKMATITRTRSTAHTKHLLSCAMQHFRRWCDIPGITAPQERVMSFLHYKLGAALLVQVAWHKNARGQPSDSACCFMCIDLCRSYVTIAIVHHLPLSEAASLPHVPRSAMAAPFQPVLFQHDGEDKIHLQLPSI